MKLPGVSNDVQTILLDIDGTLVDSNDAHAQSWVAALAEIGVVAPYDLIRPLIGMGGDQMLPLVRDGLSPDEEPGKTASARRGEIFKERFLPTLSAMPGARELLLAFRSGGVACVIATSAAPDELAALLKVANVEDLIATSSTSADATSSKPAPDIVLAAMAKAGAEPHACAMLGDTLYDIEAARKAGIPAIALHCGGAAPETLHDAVAIFDDPAALAAAL